MSDRLSNLTKNEITVLYWKCKGLKRHQIATKLGYSEDWVQIQVSNVYTKLGFDKKMHWTKRVEILEKDICPLLPKNLKDWNPTEQIPAVVEPEIITPDPEMMALVLYDEKQIEAVKKDALTPPVKEIIIIEEEKEEKEDKWKNFKRVFFAVVSLIVLLGIAYVSFTSGRGSAPAPEIIVITATPIPATETPLPTATSAIPTETATSVPTNTPAPTITPVPTEFIPPADGVLFQDNFDGGASDLWTPDITNGTWRVVNGRYSFFSDDNFKWFYNYAGDLNWRNYVIELDYSFENDSYGGLAILIRSGENGRKTLAFIIESNGGHWAVYNDGEWNNIGEETTDYFDVGHARVEVQGDTFTGVSSGGNGIVVTDPTVSETGRIGIGFWCRDYDVCPLIDNVKVTYLP